MLVRQIATGSHNLDANTIFKVEIKKLFLAICKNHRKSRKKSSLFHAFNSQYFSQPR